MNALSWALLNVFCRPRNFCSHSPRKKHNILRKKPKCPLRTNNEEKKLNRDFLLKVQKWKIVFFGRNITNCFSEQVFCCFEKTAELFLHKHRQKLIRFRDEKKRNQENTRMLPYISWMHFRKQRWNLFRRSPVYLGSQSEKNYISRKRYQNVLCTRKLANWEIFRRILLIVWKLPARSSRLKTFLFEKKTKHFLSTRILHFWDQCQKFYTQTARKVVVGLWELVILRNKKQLKHSSAHLDALSWALPKFFWSPPENFALTVLEQNIIFCGKKVPKTLLRTKNEKIYFGRVLLEVQKRKKTFFWEKDTKLHFCTVILLFWEDCRSVFAQKSTKNACAPR